MQTLHQKSCCSRFYEQPEIRLLLGGSWHPGGTQLTLELAQKMGLSSRSSLVLDIATALGTTASLLTYQLGWRTVGVDLSRRNLTEARNLSTGSQHDWPVFIQADAEHLPFQAESFNGIICECSLCTFPSKSKAATEMFRVLTHNGSLGISDIALNGRLPTNLTESLYSFLCIAEAHSAMMLHDLFDRAGFGEINLVDRKDALIDILDKLKKALFTAELLVGLKKIDIPPEKVEKAKLVLKNVTDATQGGILSYVLLTARKP